jgi:hypothetical protein
LVQAGISWLDSDMLQYLVQAEISWSFQSLQYFVHIGQSGTMLLKHAICPCLLDVRSNSVSVRTNSVHNIVLASFN